MALYHRILRRPGVKKREFMTEIAHFPGKNRNGREETEVRALTFCMCPVERKKVLCKNHLEFPDLQGASPRRWGAPVAIVPYYLVKKAESVSSGNTEISHAP